VYIGLQFIFAFCFIIIIISGATAQIGPWPLLTGFMIVIVRCGSSTIDLVLDTLIQPSETYSSNYQRL
jgi:hypothetical protein